MNWMNRGLAIAFLVVGVILLVFGISAWQSFGSSVSETVTGTPTNKAIWLLVGGAALTIFGGVGVFFNGSKRTPRTS